MKSQTLPKPLHSTTQKTSIKLASRLLEPNSSEYLTTYTKEKESKE